MTSVVNKKYSYEEICDILHGKYDQYVNVLTAENYMPHVQTQVTETMLDGQQNDISDFKVKKNKIMELFMT